MEEIGAIEALIRMETMEDIAKDLLERIKKDNAPPVWMNKVDEIYEYGVGVSPNGKMMDYWYNKALHAGYAIRNHWGCHTDLDFYYYPIYQEIVRNHRIFLEENS